jgi:hypothetical protein
MICNNLSAIHLAQNPVHHGCVKHVAIKHHWIQEYIQEGIFKMKHVYTGNMIADILTKNLGKNPFNKFQQMLFKLRGTVDFPYSSHLIMNMQIQFSLTSEKIPTLT